MPRYVDLHCHYLPALDDGARTAEGSHQMLGALAAMGFGTLHATPHQRVGMFLPSREAIDGAFAAISHTARTGLPDVALGLAAENFWDEVFHERLTSGGLPCYPGDKAFLFEVSPRFMPAGIEQTLFSVRVGGRLPVMAHPERYHAVQTDLSRAETLGRSAALLVDLGALDGAHGRVEMKTARRLLEEGLARTVTSDMHDPDDQRSIAAGIAWITKRLGPQALERMLAEAPRQILSGELP